MSFSRKKRTGGPMMMEPMATSTTMSWELIRTDSAFSIFPIGSLALQRVLPCACYVLHLQL